MRLDDCLTKHPLAVAEGPGDHMMILDLESGRYYETGLVGEFIWQRLDGQRSLQAITAEVAQHFDVESDRACDDVLTFMQQLLDAGLVVTPG